jgi:hypothetical protein
MYENSGDIKTIDEHKYTCMRVVADKKDAEKIAKGLRDEGYRSRVTVRSKRHIPKEPAGSYFPTPPHFYGDIITYCVWKGSKK